jgi:hypothetical protein
MKQGQRQWTASCAASQPVRPACGVAVPCTGMKAKIGRRGILCALDAIEIIGCGAQGSKCQVLREQLIAYRRYELNLP